MPTYLVRLGCVVWALTGYCASTPVSIAQDQAEDPARLEEIIVTGSRIKRSALESASPLLVLDRDEIELTGITSVGDLLQDLSIAGSGVNTQFNNLFEDNGGSGETQLNLRNLGSERVLVLLNGRRFVSNLEGVVDLNNIPIAVIERVEILMDGASSIYGSDAISGVVNVISRRDFDGFQIDAYIGQYRPENDGEIRSVDLSAGRQFERTSLFFSASHAEQDPIFAGDRPISAEPIFGTGTALGSLGTPQGVFCAFAVNGCAALLTTDPGTNVTGPGGLGAGAFRAGDFASNRPGAGTDRYNFAPEFYTVTPQERSALFAQIGHVFTPRLRLTTEASFGRRKSHQRWAAQPLFLGLAANSGSRQAGVAIAADNAFNPFGEPLVPGTYVLVRRLVEAGPRVFSQESDHWRLALGLEGSAGFAGRSLAWDLNYVYADLERDDLDRGRVNIERLAQALSGQPCRDDVFGDGCVELNLFGGQGPDGSGTITPAMVDYILFTAASSIENKLEQFTANITGELTSLPAGPLKFAAGYEHRSEEGRFLRDATQAAGLDADFFSVPLDTVQGAFDVDELYLELAVPLLAERLAAERLDLSLSSRFSDYDTAGETTNSKVGLEWQPVDDLLLRATFSEGFRAPSIFSLFEPTRVVSLSQANDPCLGLDTDGDGQPDTNPGLPGCAGLPGTLSADNQPPITGVLGGNPNLEPETSESVTAGVVYSPAWADGLDLAVDYYNIELGGTISESIAPLILNLCANTGLFLCERIQRDPLTGRILELDGTVANIGGSEVEGVDFQISYHLPESRWGFFQAGWTGAYQGTNDETIVAADGSGLVTINNLGVTELSFEEGVTGARQLDTSYPRWKSNVDLFWKRGSWEAAWNLQYIHGSTERCEISPAFGFCNADLDGDGDPSDGRRIGGTTYHDVQVSYYPTRFDARLSIGVLNVFDKGPPLSTNVLIASFNRADYRLPGRFPYLRLTIGL